MTDRLLVTGAAGFLGSHTVLAALERGHDVVGLVRPGEASERVPTDVPVEAIDFSDAAAVEAAVSEISPRAVIHCAGVGAHGGSGALADEDTLFEANVALVWRMLAALFGAAESAPATGPSAVRSFVSVSSAGVYGPTPPLPTSEEAPLAPASAYARSKVAMEALCASAGRATGIAMPVARPFNITGPGEPAASVIGEIARQAGAGPGSNATDGRRSTDFRIRLREATSSRDFVHVADVASALVLLAERGESRPYNVCTGRETTIRDLVDTTATVLGVPIRLDVADPAARGSRSVGDPSLLRALGWRPERSVADALGELLAEMGRP